MVTLFTLELPISRDFALFVFYKKHVLFKHCTSELAIHVCILPLFGYPFLYRGMFIDDVGQKQFVGPINVIKVVGIRLRGGKISMMGLQ